MRRNSMCGIARSRLSKFFQFVVAENEARRRRERSNVAHFGVLFEITKRFLEIGVQFLFAHAADDAAARAISAVAGATIRHQKQNAIWIAMDQTRHRHVRIFAARVRHVVRRRPRFFDPRNDLAPDRIVRIIPRDQVEKVRGNRERQFIAGKQTPARSSSLKDRCSSRVRVVTRFSAISSRSKAPAQLCLLPRPIARRVGTERFFLLNVLGEIHHFRNLWAKT